MLRYNPGKEEFIEVMQDLVLYDFVLTSCATINNDNKERILTELREYNKPMLIHVCDNTKDNFWLYVPAGATGGQCYYFKPLSVTPEQSKLIAKLFEQHEEEIAVNGYKIINNPTLEVHYVTAAILEATRHNLEDTGHNLEQIKPLEDGRYYSLLLLTLDMKLTDQFHEYTAPNEQNNELTIELNATMEEYGHDLRGYPNSIIIKGMDGSFWFYYKELKKEENYIFEKLKLDDKQTQELEEFFRKKKNNNGNLSGKIKATKITQPDHETEKIDLILKQLLGLRYKTPSWYRRMYKEIGGTDGMIASKTYDPDKTKYMYKARWNSYDLYFMEVKDFNECYIKANSELLKKNAPIIIKDLKSQQFIFCFLTADGLQSSTLSDLDSQEAEFIACIFNNSLAKDQPLVATDVNRMEVTVQNSTKKGIELYELLKKHTYYNMEKDDFEWFFYESFGEGVSSAVFRYILGSQAPKNDLIYIPNQPPGIVSEYLQDDFYDLEEIRKFLDRVLPGTTSPRNEKLKQLLSDYINTDKSSQKINDEEKDAIIKKLILSQDNIEYLIAVSCFLSDIDGKLANIGILFRGSEKFAARVDFGTAFAKLKNNLGALCKYLLEPDASPQQDDYSKIYGDLLYAKKFKEALFKIALINKEHLRIILEQSVARFMYAWQGIKISNKSIDKLREHLLGKDIKEWDKKYFINEQNEVVFNWKNVKSISAIIMDSLTIRQEEFMKLARDLESIPLLRIFEGIMNNTFNDIKNLDISETLAAFINSIDSKAIKSLARYRAEELIFAMRIIEKKGKNKIKSTQDLEDQDRDKICASLVQIEGNINWWKILLCLLGSLKSEYRITEIAAKYHLFLQELHDTDNIEDEVKAGLLSLASNIIKSNLFNQDKTYYPFLIVTNQYFVIDNKLLNGVLNDNSIAGLQQTLINKHTKYAKVGIIGAWDGDDKRVKLQRIVLPIDKAEDNNYKLKSPAVVRPCNLYMILKEADGITIEEDYSEFIQFVNEYTTLNISPHNLATTKGNSLSFLLLQACVAARIGNLSHFSLIWQTLKSEKEKWPNIVVLMLHIAVVKKQKDAVEYLTGLIKDFNLNAILEAGNISYKNSDNCFGMQDYYKLMAVTCTEIDIAVSSHNTDAVIKLIENNGSKNIRKTVILTDVMYSKYSSDQPATLSYGSNLQGRGPILRRRSLSDGCLTKFQPIAYNK